MSIAKNDWYRVALCDAADAYGEAHRTVVMLTEKLDALREERTTLSEDDPRQRTRVLKRIFKDQTTLVTKWATARQRRNIALSEVEKILREHAILESK